MEIQMYIFHRWTNLSKFWVLAGLIFLMGCGKGKKALEEAALMDEVLMCDPEKYDLACMKDEKTSSSDDLLEKLGGIREDVIKASGKEISDQRQDEYGDNSRAEITKQFPIVEGHPKASLLEGIMHKLLRERRNPSGIGFHVFVVRSGMVNAFTLGGEIYVTTALLDEAESLDEIACILGHEIGHNELDHVADKLKEVELAQGIFGEETGTAIAEFVGVLTMGFNQHNEAEADLYGIDLALAAGYDACRGIDFWNRLKAQEGEANDLENFFRSHPYSSRRAACYRSHISTLHQLTCEK
jgi:predicted Zn-dependent protease